MFGDGVSIARRATDRGDLATIRAMVPLAEPTLSPQNAMTLAKLAQMTAVLLVEGMAVILGPVWRIGTTDQLVRDGC